MSWKKLLESTSESLDDHLRLRNDYLMAENRILRNQINGHVQLTDSERKELAKIGAKLGKQALQEIATVAQPDTILAWNRKWVDKPVNPSKRPKPVGRPRVAAEIEEWVVRMARENRSWGYDRIQGSLKHLGYTISDQTVGNILGRHGIPPAPEREKTVTWREFVRSHWEILVVTGFFNSEAWSGLRLIVSCLLRIAHFSCRPLQSMPRPGHQLIQTMQALTQCCLTLRCQVRRWGHLFQEPSKATRGRDTVLEQQNSEAVLAEA